jgi:hypothetical protein
MKSEMHSPDQQADGAGATAHGGNADQAHEYEIVVNARQVDVPKGTLSYIEVVRLAFEHPVIDENTIYTVAYKRGHGDKPEGTMVDGDTVKIKNGMIFYVTPTNRS